MTTISGRQPDLWIQYDSIEGRKAKYFPSAAGSRKFYTRQLELGNNPAIHKELPMTDEDSVTVEEDKDVVTTEAEVKKENQSPPKGKTVKKKAKNPKVTPKKSTGKRAPKKKPVTKKKAPAKKKAVANGSTKSAISETQINVLKLLAKKPNGLTRSEISKGLDGAFIGGRIMGHVDPAKRIDTSLVARKMVKVEDVEEKQAAVYSILAAGKKAIGK